MPRPPRITVPSMVYHVINRRVMRLPLLQKPADYLAFQRVLQLGLRRPDAPRLLAWCLMPNHWHLVLQATANSQLSTWMQWLTVTHTHRWHQHYHCAGQGPVYQGRFKSFPIQHDEHLLTVLRYVEANAVRAGLVASAEQWRWGSLPARVKPSKAYRGMLGDLPVELAGNWVQVVNAEQGESELTAIHQSIARGTPLGGETWAEQAARLLHLGNTSRQRGRPHKVEKSAILMR